MNFYNQDPDEDNPQSLRLAMMFKEELDEATRAYMELLRLSIDDEVAQNPAEVTKAVQDAINAALVTGIHAYRSWLQSQGVDVEAIEVDSGKDIPLDFFRPAPRWVN